jgi:hypothetical protein
MATRIQNASRSAMTDAITALLNGGSAAGHVEVRTGTQPADPDSAASGALLATVTLNDPAFGAATDGVATADVTPALTQAASADGNAGWFRGFDSNNASVIDGSVTATGGGGDMQLNTIALVNGVDFTITSWTITMPAS